MTPKEDTPEHKESAFKKYRDSKKNKPDLMETSFGSHSLPKKTELMSTSFGKHSEKIVEKVSPDSVPRISGKDNKHIHENVAPIKDLGEHQLDAVHDYSDESRPLNDMLHRHAKGYDISTKNADSYRNTAKHLDETLNTHKTKEDMHVYTGIKYSPSKHFKKVDGKIPDKKVVRLPAFTSTSSGFHNAREFSDMTMHPNDERHGIEHSEDGEARHVLKIHVPKGSHAMSLKKHSFVPAENEILLHRGHHIEIDSKPTKTDRHTYIWNAKIVHHHAPDLDKPVE